MKVVSPFERVKGEDVLVSPVPVAVVSLYGYPPRSTILKIRKRLDQCKSDREKLKIFAMYPASYILAALGLGPSTKKWTEEEKDMVRILYVSGKTIEQIAKELKRTENSIRVIIKKMRIHRRKVSHVWHGRKLILLFMLYLAGRSHREIAITLKTTEKAVEHAISRYILHG